jgi:hypothetical protein
MGFSTQLEGAKGALSPTWDFGYFGDVNGRFRESSGSGQVSVKGRKRMDRFRASASFTA